ncbi:hypothetical protein [Thermocatellispora tengchongensis]|uniref:hypothetical protein n=1 Tax=Thermocatellispora tengchongensis TaxID=1073253 RepID=UPI003632EE28
MIACPTPNSTSSTPATSPWRTTCRRFATLIADFLDPTWKRPDLEATRPGSDPTWKRPDLEATRPGSDRTWK